MVVVLVDSDEVAPEFAPPLEVPEDDELDEGESLLEVDELDEDSVDVDADASLATAMGSIFAAKWRSLSPCSLAFDSNVRVNLMLLLPDGSADSGWHWLKASLAVCSASVFFGVLVRSRSVTEPSVAMVAERLTRLRPLARYHLLSIFCLNEFK